MTNPDPLEVENAYIPGKLKGLSGDALYDRLHPKRDDNGKAETKADLLTALRDKKRKTQTSNQEGKS